jgi:hypothetical protein
MKHIKKFNESLPGSKERELHDAAVKQIGMEQERDRQSFAYLKSLKGDQEIVGKKKLSDAFEKLAEAYANLIIYSPQYSKLKDMAIDRRTHKDSVEMNVGGNYDQSLVDWSDEFKKTFPGFVDPGLEDLATGMKLPFYGRTRGENPSSKTVVFFKYLISKIQKPGYKL